MSDQVQMPSLILNSNPYLDEEIPAAEETAQSPEQENASAVATQEAQENVARRVYEIDPDNLYGSIKKLYDEDPHVRNVLKSFMGRERQKELKNRIRELEAELSQERLARSQLMLKGIPEDQLPQLLQQDENLRNAYEYVENYSETDYGALEIEDLIEEEFEQAEAWLPPGRIQNYIAAMGPGGCKCDAIKEPHGVFDHDENGRELGPLRAFQRFRSVLGQEVEMARHAYEVARNQGMRQPVAESPVRQSVEVPQQVQQAQQPPKQQPTRAQVAQAVDSIRNPALNVNPDLSVGGYSGGGAPITKEELDRMPVDEIIRRWPNPGDFERAVEAGQVLIPGINA